ncbi:substrate-binding periplasmic protein [Pseudomonas abietaniphila]
MEFIQRITLARSIALVIGVTVFGQAGGGDLSNSPIRVVTENLSPYNMIENGEVTGLSTDVVKAVLSSVGDSPRIEVLPWARAYDIALHSENVLIYSIARTPARERLFKWVGAIAPTNWYLFSLSDRPVTLSSLEDAKRYRIATVKQDVGEQFLLAHGFEFGRQLQSSSTYEHNYRKLKVDHVELWISNELNAISLMRKHGDDPITTMVRSLPLPELSSEDGLYMAFSLGTSDDIVERYRQDLQSIRARGDYDAIMEKWLGEVPPQIPMSSEKNR